LNSSVTTLKMMSWHCSNSTNIYISLFWGTFLRTNWLSLALTYFFTEDTEKTVLKQATRKRVCWFQYVEDTFIIWPHGREKLTEYLNHLNGFHTNIQFTIEKGHLPFLDIDIYRETDGSLGQSLSGAHPHHSLSTLGFTSSSCKQTISPRFPDTQSRSSLWSGFPYSRTGIFYLHFQG